MKYGLTIITMAALLAGCSTDPPLQMSDTGGTGTDASETDMGPDETDGGDQVDTGVDTGPTFVPAPTVVTPTSGGGTMESGGSRLRLHTGTPQPQGETQSKEHRLIVGPTVPR